MSSVVRRSFLAFVMLIAATSSAFAIGSAFTFQGRLAENESPLEGTVDLVFSLFDAESAGSQIGNSQTVTGLTVINGLINVELNGADEFGPDAFNGEDRWIEVSVDGNTLSPRQKVTAAPYSLTSVTLEPGASITGSDDVLTVTSTNGSNNHAITGIATSGGQNPAGVYGETGDGSGRGVFGLATSTSGSNAGVRGETLSDNSSATGVFGLASSASSAAAGVKGQCNGVTNGYGVWGTGGANATGVLAQANAGRGLWAISGSGPAIRAETTNSGNLIEGWTQSPVNKRFQVDSAGNVTADGTYTSPAADFAEMLPAASGLEPGDVLVVAPDGTLAQSRRAFERAVVGVYSTRPAFLGGYAVDGPNAEEVPLAVVGIVPVKASTENGPIEAGDMLVASATAGHAMRSGDDPPQGTVIGKALSELDAGKGTVTLLVMMQ